MENLPGGFILEKERYESPDLDIIEFAAEDIVRTSLCDTEMPPECISDSV